MQNAAEVLQKQQLMCLLKVMMKLQCVKARVFKFSTLHLKSCVVHDSYTHTEHLSCFSSHHIHSLLLHLSQQVVSLTTISGCQGAPVNQRVILTFHCNALCLIVDPLCGLYGVWLVFQPQEPAVTNTNTPHRVTTVQWIHMRACIPEMLPSHFLHS